MFERGSLFKKNRSRRTHFQNTFRGFIIRVLKDAGGARCWTPRGKASAKFTAKEIRTSTLKSRLKRVIIVIIGALKSVRTFHEKYNSPFFYHA